MKAFFATEERVKALRFHALELVDTPFAAHAMMPGVGIDCVHVNAWCYLKTGFLKSFEPPAYALDEGQHTERKDSKLIKWLEGSGKFERLDDDRIFFVGDTLCFDTGKSEFHVGLMLDENRFIHVLAMARGRVIVSDLEREVYYHRRVRAAYRPMEGQA